MTQTALSINYNLTAPTIEERTGSLKLAEKQFTLVDSTATTNWSAIYPTAER